jgi:hypothetical protein
MEICNLLDGFQHLRGTCWFHLQVWPCIVLSEAKKEKFLSTGSLWCLQHHTIILSACAVTGVVVMEGFRIVFNQSSKTVGFAKSMCGPTVSLSGPFETETGGLS